MRLELPDYVHAVLRELALHGQEGYAVGGCVRDSLLGKTPQDWDLATSATPEETLRALAKFRLLETGLRHGTVTALVDGHAVEVTTYRVDGDYSDHRHPDRVTFARTLREDLSRRDFTINALAYRPESGLIDCFGGVEDLKHRVLRCVGEPDLRFEEDALRILRGLRFSSTLGFSVEPATASSLVRNRALLHSVSAERVATELLKLLCGQNVRAVLLGFAPVFTALLPELAPAVGFLQNNPHHCYDVYTHTAYAVAAAPPLPRVRLALLLHDLGKPHCATDDALGIRHFYGHATRSAALAATIAARLRLDSATTQRVCTLVKHHDSSILPERPLLLRRLRRFGADFLHDLMLVKHADNLAQSPDANRQALFYAVDKLLAELLQENACFTLHQLAVNGDDLLAAGIPAGKQLGEALQHLLTLVIEEKCPNEKAALLQALLHWLSSRKEPPLKLL